MAKTSRKGWTKLAKGWPSKSKAWPTKTKESSGKSKYNNIKVVIDGHKFDSKAEGERYKELKIMVRAGEIIDLELQPRFVLIEGVKFGDGSKKKPPLRYRADFRYIDARTGESVVEDVKSKITRDSTDYKMRRHMMLHIHGIEVIEIIM